MSGHEEEGAEGPANQDMPGGAGGAEWGVPPTPPSPAAGDRDDIDGVATEDGVRGTAAAAEGSAARAAGRGGVQNGATGAAAPRAACAAAPALWLPGRCSPCGAFAAAAAGGGGPPCAGSGADAAAAGAPLCLAASCCMGAVPKSEARLLRRPALCLAHPRRPVHRACGWQRRLQALGVDHRRVLPVRAPQKVHRALQLRLQRRQPRRPRGVLRVCQEPLLLAFPACERCCLTLAEFGRCTQRLTRFRLRGGAHLR